jgi:beta-lactamase class A
VAAAAILLLVDCVGSTGDASNPTVTPSQPAPVIPPPTTPTTPTPDSATASPPIEVDPQIARAVETLLDGQRGVYGVVVMQPDGAITYQLNPDTPFVAASLYKLVLLANIYEKREHGELSFAQELELLPEYFPAPDDFADSFYDRSVVGNTASIDELVYATGSYSSNVAAKALLSQTDTTSLDETTIELGLADTYLFIDPSTLPAWSTATATGRDAALLEAMTFVDAEAQEGPVNITTPRDMSHFFQLLLAGEVVNPEVSAELLALLKQQMIDDRFPYLLPGGTEMAHKTGNLDHVVHDVGIIWAPDGPVILAAMIEDPPDDDRATQIIQRLALIAYGTDKVPPFTKHASSDSSPSTDQ